MYLLSFIRMGGRESNTYMFMLFHYKEGREFFSQKGKKGGGNAGWSCLKNVDCRKSRTHSSFVNLATHSSKIILFNMSKEVQKFTFPKKKKKFFYFSRRFFGREVCKLGLNYLQADIRLYATHLPT